MQSQDLQHNISHGGAKEQNWFETAAAWLRHCSLSNLELEHDFSTLSLVDHHAVSEVYSVLNSMIYHVFHYQ